jgi:hypothetical protein
LKRYTFIASLAGILALVSSTGAFAHGSETTDLLLAPIPTVLDYGEWEYGIRGTLGEEIEKGRQYNNSIHGSLFNNLEVGATWNLQRPVGPFSWGVKYQILDNQRDDDFISLAVGLGNNTGITGPAHTDAQGYIVASRDFGNDWTWYLGYIHFDGNDNDVYAGFDWRPHERWHWRAEYLGQSDNEDALISGGFRYEWIKHVDLSAWLTHDTFAEDTSITLEFALRGDLRDLTEEEQSIVH